MNQYSSFESMTQTQLMNCINEISFALDDLLLYLDTHPYDCNALQYVNQFIRQRNTAVVTLDELHADLPLQAVYQVGQAGLCIAHHLGGLGKAAQIDSCH